MSLTALIADSALLLAIICVSLYGAVTLPPGARIPLHFGPSGYNRWVPKNAGLVLYPGIGTVVYAVVAGTVHDHQANGRPGPSVGLSIALGVILITQIGALTVARTRNHR